MPMGHGLHPAYREESVPKAKKSKPEEVPDASERASFYRGATKEAMEDRGKSVAELDKKSTRSKDYSGHAMLRTEGATRADMDKLKMRKIGDYAATAAEYEDKASGRKKKD